MANRSSLAYDFSVYEPKQKAAPQKQTLKTQQAQKVKQDQQTQAKQRQPRISMEKNPIPLARKESAFKFAIKAFMVLAILCAVLYGNVESNALFNEIRGLESELKNLQSENITLAAEYEARTSLKNVEDYAENVLSLKKLDKSQKEYIDLPADTVIEVVETENKNIFIIIRNKISELREYLGA